MTLRQQMIDDVSDVFLDTEEHAETITYNPLGVAGSSISAVVDDADDMESIGVEDGKGRMRSCRLYVDTSDVTSPTIDSDTFTVRTIEYKLRAVENKDEGMLCLRCEAWTTIRKSRQDYQRDR